MTNASGHAPAARRPNARELSPFISVKRLDYAAEVASYYGFLPIRPPLITKDDSNKARRLSETDAHPKQYGSPDSPLFVNVEEKISLLRTCEEKRLLNNSQPTMLYYQGTPARAGQKKMARSPANKHMNLDVIGTAKSVAEAELIKAAFEILHNEGFDDLYIDINSIGDRDSVANFTRELGNYYRKHADDLPNHCRTKAKKDVFAPLECEDPRCRAACEHAPTSVASLTGPSRAHLAEVLEFLESMNIPYKIDNRVLGNRKVCCHTVFLIKTLDADREDSPETTLGLGFRYNSLSKKAEMKRDLPAVGITLAFKRRQHKRRKSHALKKPHAYFIQLGFEAKLKSLEVIEVLRRARIPVYQALAKDKLTSQIATAENMKIPFILILGQKEALGNNIIVRNMATRFQETVPIKDLPAYLKSLH